MKKIKKIFLNPKLGTEKIAEEIMQFIPNKEMYYVVAKRRFSKENYVSSGLLQRCLQISYSQARRILDKIIEEGFCETQEGATPCRVIKSIKVN